MKRTFKFLTVILLIGALLCVAGVALGGQIYTSYSNHQLYSLADMISAASRDYRRGAMHVGGYQEFLFPEKYDSIKLTLDRGEFDIYEGDTLSIAGSTGGSYSAEVIGGVLNISCTAPRYYDDIITIVLPHSDADDSRYSKVTIEADASDVSVNTDFYASSTSISADAANLDFYGKISTETLEIDANAAAVEANWVDATNIDLDCNAGSMDLTLYGYPNDYQIYSDSVLGELTLNGQPFFLGGNENTSRFISTNVNAGSINLFTTLDND